VSPRTLVDALKEREIFYAFTPYVGKWKILYSFVNCNTCTRFEVGY